MPEAFRVAIELPASTRRLGVFALGLNLPHVSLDFVRDVELLFGVPAEFFLDEPDFVVAERRAVGLGRILHVRAAVSDMRAELYHARPLVLGLGVIQGLFEARHIVAVAGDFPDVPSVGLEALGPVLGEGKLGLAVDADVVVVVDNDKIVQPQMPGQRAGLGGNAFLQVAVAGDDVYLVVDDREALAVEVARQILLCDSHSHSVGNPLTQRPGGDLDTQIGCVFRVPGRFAAPLAEVLHLVQAQIVACKMKQRVDQSAAVTG